MKQCPPTTSNPIGIVCVSLAVGHMSASVPSSLTAFFKHGIVSYTTHVLEAQVLASRPSEKPVYKYTTLLSLMPGQEKLSPRVVPSTTKLPDMSVHHLLLFPFLFQKHLLNSNNNKNNDDDVFTPT